MTKLQEAIDHLTNDSNWELMNDKDIFTNALKEIEYRLEVLEKK